MLNKGHLLAVQERSWAQGIVGVRDLELPGE